MFMRSSGPAAGHRPARIGVIGCGRIAQLIHLPVLARQPGARIVALADPDAASRAAAARLAPLATLYADHERLLEDADVEAVVVAAPNALHAPVAVAAFELGRHVYLEKPIACTLDDARRVVAAWRNAGRVGMAGFAFRFAAAYRDARARLAHGEIGEVVAVRTVFCSKRRELPEWKRRRSDGGGVLLDLASHHIDAIPFLLDDPLAAVSASVRSIATEDDTASVTMRTASGVMVQGTFSSAGIDRHRVEILGDRGGLLIDPWASDRATPLDGGAAGRVDRLRDALSPRRVLHRPDYHAPFRDAFAAFLAAVASGGAPTPDLADGLRCLAAVEAAERAAASGREQTVEAPLAPAAAAP
jgi:predicted dehydrogenase